MGASNGRARPPRTNQGCSPTVREGPSASQIYGPEVLNTYFKEPKHPNYRVGVGPGEGVGDGETVGLGEAVGLGSTVGLGEGCGFTSLQAFRQVSNAVLHSVWLELAALRHA